MAYNRNCHYNISRIVNNTNKTKVLNNYFNMEVQGYGKFKL